MKKHLKNHKFRQWFEKISSKITLACGSPPAVISAVLVVAAWALTGPIFNFSETWQLVINTGTTIITFIMVFIIQHSQNKDSTAVQMKLNELLAANESASNRLVNSEELSQEELLLLKKFYKRLSELSKKENDLFSSHSVDEANDNHDWKQKKEGRYKSNKKAP
jgi:low affinity Fe/Cu permease